MSTHADLAADIPRILGRFRFHIVDIAVMLVASAIGIIAASRLLRRLVA